MFFKKKSGYQRWMDYWRKHPNYTSLVHFLGGMGFAWVVMPYFSASCLVSWGWALLLVTIVGHIYPIFTK